MLLEVVSIVVAILLAFALNSWNDDRKTHAAVNESLVDIRHEVAGNREALMHVMPLHEKFNAGYADYAQKHRRVSVDQFYALFHAYAPHGFRPFRGETTAWDIARTLPSATAIPLDVRTAIERTYAEQDRVLLAGQQLLNDIHVTASTDDPNLYLAVTGMILDTGDVVAAEDRLLKFDDDLLKELPAG